jgi:F0F1-type ATP synthase membrane subunit a
LIHLLNEFSFFLLKKRFLNLTFLLLIILILSLLEICVRIIQAYIFCRLVNIYLCENFN